MEESNISRDHIAMEAMKVLLNKLTCDNTSLTGRIKRMFGMPVIQIGCISGKELAKAAYYIADAMIEEREKGGKE